MYNFLDPVLLPKVTTKCSATDMYEVNNLISPNFLTKSRGFIAYTTMKPPIDIDFQLICNVSLSYILISSKIGSHKSSGIEVFVKNANSQYISICKAFYEKNGVVFCNSRYYLKNKPLINQDDYHISYFRSNEFRAFTNADVIRIRILKTNGTIPCLESIEIWGGISKSCSYETTKTIRRLGNKNKSLPMNVTNNDNAIDLELFEIPDEFKDALTYELMAIPMTLPSGHTIDQSTLEKCLSTDASCGRHNCDPFTGLHYTRTRKPVLNVALKTRIDMFLLRNSHLPEINGVKRTLGTAKDYNLISDSLKMDATESNYSDISQISKKIKLDCDNSNKNISLDAAIQSALNSKNFIRFTASDSSSKKETINENVCVVCNKQENLYMLPCKHLYCRTCSLNLDSKLKCSACNIEFNKSDLRKHHC